MKEIKGENRRRLAQVVVDVIYVCLAPRTPPTKTKREEDWLLLVAYREPGINPLHLTAFKIQTFDQYVLLLIAGREVKLASSINPVQLPGRIIVVTEKISEGERRRERGSHKE